MFDASFDVMDRAILKVANHSPLMPGRASQLLNICKDKGITPDVAADVLIALASVNVIRDAR